MNDKKPRWESKTQRGIIVGFLAFVLGQFGIDIDAGTQSELVTNILNIAMGVSFIVAFIGRQVAKKRLK